MSKNQLFIFLFIILSGFVACNENESDNGKKLDAEIMVVHNEVMPKMAEINRTKRQLMAYKDIVADENALLKDSIINAILVLSKSEDLMDDWMMRYKFPNPDVPKEEVNKYLTGQKDTIKSISEDIFKSLSIAHKYLESAPDSLRK